MVRYSLLSIALSVCIAICFVPLASAQVTLSDGDFNPSNWEDIVYLHDPNASVSAITTQPSGGHPGAHREMAFQWDTLTDLELVWLFSKYTATSYNPSVQGAIISINYSEHGRVTSDSIGTLDITLPARIGLEQNGSIYRSAVITTVQSPPFPGPWEGLSLNNLVAANFVKHSGPGPTRPDFSETGSEIYFGYIRGNQNQASNRTIVTNIDNWSVTINQETDASYTIDKLVLDDAHTEISSADVGDTIIYRITLANTGGVDLTGIEIVDNLPHNLAYNSYVATPTHPGVTYAPGPPATVAWPLGDLAVGESASLDIDMTIQTGADHQRLTNQAEVTAINAPAASGQTASVGLTVGEPEADLEFVLISSVDLGDVGGGVFKTRVTSTVRNNGAGDAEAVVVVYDYPRTLESPEAIVTGDPIGNLMVCEDRPVQREFYCELPMPNTFNAGVTAELVVDYVRTGNTVNPNVTMTAATLDPVPSNNDYTLPAVDSTVSRSSGNCFIQSLFR